MPVRADGPEVSEPGFAVRRIDAGGFFDDELRAAKALRCRSTAVEFTNNFRRWIALERAGA